MLETLGFRVADAERLKELLVSGATFQVWTDPTPSDAASAATGTLLADGTVVGADISVNSATAALVIQNLSDTQINATGKPRMLRIVDNTGTLQFSAKMAAEAGDAEVVITDTSDAAALELLQNRAFTATLTIQH